eukprot:SAG31_NODE_1299_length_8918_cov_59.994671_4_plen_135_part_00
MITDDNDGQTPRVARLCDSLFFILPTTEATAAGQHRNDVAGAAVVMPFRAWPLLERQTSVPILVLWNVFLFWVAVATTHSETLLLDTVLETALGICAIVGVTLNTNAYAMWAEPRKSDSSVFEFISTAPFSFIR